MWQDEQAASHGTVVLAALGDIFIHASKQTSALRRSRPLNLGVLFKAKHWQQTTPSLVSNLLSPTYHPFSKLWNHRRFPTPTMLNPIHDSTCSAYPRGQTARRTISCKGTKQCREATNQIPRRFPYLPIVQPLLRGQETCRTLNFVSSCLKQTHKTIICMYCNIYIYILYT